MNRNQYLNFRKKVKIRAFINASTFNSFKLSSINVDFYLPTMWKSSMMENAGSFFVVKCPAETAKGCIIVAMFII